MAIIADEVFLDYGDGPAPAATFAFEPAALTFTLSGLSKISLLPQMKLAWIATSGPESLVRTAIERLDIIADTYLSPSAPVQLGLPKFLSMRQHLQAQLQQRVTANLVHLDRILSSASQVARLKRDGGWYAVLRVPATISDEDHAIALLKRTSVVVHPGHFFNFAQEGFLVASLIAPEKEFQEGIRRLRTIFWLLVLIFSPRRFIPAHRLSRVSALCCPSVFRIRRNNTDFGHSILKTRQKRTICTIDRIETRSVEKLVLSRPALQLD